MGLGPKQRKPGKPGRGDATQKPPRQKKLHTAGRGDARKKRLQRGHNGPAWPSDGPQWRTGDDSSDDPDLAWHEFERDQMWEEERKIKLAQKKAQREKEPKTVSGKQRDAQASKDAKTMRQALKSLKNATFMEDKEKARLVRDQYEDAWASKMRGYQPEKLRFHDDDIAHTLADGSTIYGAIILESIHNDADEALNVWWQTCAGGPPFGGHQYQFLEANETTPPKEMAGGMDHQVCVKELDNDIGHWCKIYTSLKKDGAQQVISAAEVMSIGCFFHDTGYYPGDIIHTLPTGYQPPSLTQSAPELRSASENDSDFLSAQEWRSTSEYISASLLLLLGSIMLALASIGLRRAGKYIGLEPTHGLHDALVTV